MTQEEEEILKRIKILCDGGYRYAGYSSGGLVLDVVIPWEKMTAFLFLVTDLQLTRKRHSPGGT